MAIIQWDGISNFEDKIFLINAFNHRCLSIIPSQEPKTKPYAIVTGRKWPDLIQGRSLSHAYCMHKVPEGAVITKAWWSGL